MRDIIKGAIYTDGNVLLRPHYSGYFITVDCSEFLPKAEIKASYSKNFYKDCIKNNLKLSYEGVDFFECEYSPYHTNDFILLSDLSNLEFFDEETSF